MKQTSGPAAGGRLGAFVVLAGSLGMLALHALSWFDPTGRREVAVWAAEHRAHASGLPWSEFVRDRQNVIHGVVKDTQHRPIEGALVRLYDSAELERAVGAAFPGEWPRPRVEREVLSDRSGHYRSQR